MKKRIVSFILSFLLVFSTLPVNVFASEENTAPTVKADLTEADKSLVCTFGQEAKYDLSAFFLLKEGTDYVYTVKYTVETTKQEKVIWNNKEAAFNYKAAQSFFGGDVSGTHQGTVTVSEKDDATKTATVDITVIINQKPSAVSGKTAKLSMNKDALEPEGYSIDLKEYYTDGDNHSLSFATVTETEEGTVKNEIKDGIFKITQEEAKAYKIGTTEVKIVVSDGYAELEGIIYCVAYDSDHSIPSDITIEFVPDTEYVNQIPETTTLIGKNGDVFKFRAKDENGNNITSSLDWGLSTQAVQGTFKYDKEEDVVVFTTTAGMGGYLWVRVKSKVDTTFSRDKSFATKTYVMSNFSKNVTVTLSEDGQTAKTISTSGGVSGYNQWTYEIPEGIAKYNKESGIWIYFDALRPGTFKATVTLNFNDAMTDTATLTIQGVAVEDEEGKQTKTYIKVNGAEEESTVKLTAYLEEGHKVESWSTSNESIASVDQNGKVTAKKAGSVIITATDDQGKKGGIKVVVKDEKTPYFENITFKTGTKALSKDISFDATTLEYDGLDCYSYSVSTLEFGQGTLYDTEKYEAVASYTDINGVEHKDPIASGASTVLKDLAFGTTKIRVLLTDKSNKENTTEYVFEVTRPRDTTNTLAYQASFSVDSDERELSKNLYNGKVEGFAFRADENGVWDGKNIYGPVAAHYNYHTWLQDGLKSFKLNLKGGSAYTHIRYSIDEGATWTEVKQGGGVTETIKFPERIGDENPEVKVVIQVLDDKTYAANIEAGKEGFEEGTPKVYKVWAEQLPQIEANLLTAEADHGDFYPAFSSEYYNYLILVKKGESAPTITFTTTDETTVTVDGKTMEAVDGKYSILLENEDQNVVLTRKGGTRTYTFRYKEKVSDAAPDKVIDYLPINSQYTNVGSYGLVPTRTLTGGDVLSLGNFGGYITYYYENGLTDNPNNKYGVDFYIYGNAFKDTSTGTGLGSMEPGQVWVSEDGENWYALAGSEHYEESTVWDYTVTYSKTEDGKTTWKDNYGNTDNGTQVGSWPLLSNYPWNSLLSEDTISLKGILLPCVDGSLTGNGEFSSFSKGAKFGYVDTLVNSNMGEDANPYLENDNYELNSSGFDLAWAVDENGDPVDVSGKEFHYVKVVTASNLWAGMANEKSTEVKTVIRTTAQDEAVGVSKATGITISGSGKEKQVTFEDGKQIYEVDLDSMKYISIRVNGTSENANIYVNNVRVDAGQAAEGLKVSKEAGVKLVRVIVQDGEKEPVIYLLKLTSNASSGEDLVNDVKIDVNGVVKNTDTKDGENYQATVAYRLDKVAITPMLVDGDVQCTINGEAVKETYELKTGENVFVIKATKGDITDTVTLIITKEEAPESTGEITVYFSLLGDEEHGDSGEKHTLVSGNLDTWIPQTEYKLETPSVVLDLLEIALAGKYEFTNSGNYISKIGKLGEFSNGANSGWMYTLNGIHSDLGIAEQTLKDGDVIVFHYTDDYNLENYDEVSSVEYVEKLIDDIGTVSLKSAASIAAARKAYDKLSEEDKEKVENYKVLLSAEKTYDALVKELQDGLKELDSIYTTTGKYLVENVKNPTVSSIGGEWTILGLARSGYKVPEKYMDTYVNNLLNIMKEKQGVLHTKKYTEYERVILALTSIGYDITDVAGYNLLDYMADYDKVVWQGINSVAFALIALDSHDYDIPEVEDGKAQTTREKLIDYLLNSQLEDNGWALSVGTKADSDVTAMVLQALAPYYEKDVKVTAAVNKALVTLSELQDENGFYCDNNKVATLESTAQVITALTALGINPDTDERFVKNNKSVLDALCAFYVDGGGFSHVLGEGRNGMATEQGYYALASYYRLMNNQTSLYDMSDVTIEKNENNGSQSPEVTPGETPKEDVPEQPTNGNGNLSDGDNTPVELALTLLIVSAMSMVVLLKKREKIGKMK